MTRDNVLGSFSFDVAKRMLDILNQDGSRKKTNLASKAGLNYNVCLKYIQMLNSLGWVKVNSEVSITEKGKEVYTKLLDISKTIASTGEGVWPSDQVEKGIEDSQSYGVSSIHTKLPQSSSLSHDEQIALENKQEIDINNKTIMIVDDEEDVAETYGYYLSSVGYEIRTFIDSRLALHEYVSDPFRYDLLVLDIRMQGLNGLQLYQSIKAINPTCRAIFVSALDAATEVVSILPGTKPQNIIRKPVSKEQFVSAVKTALTK
jgi:CheY-like chemotaxis protein/predicted transcriptional regulator